MNLHFNTFKLSLLSPTFLPSNFHAVSVCSPPRSNIGMSYYHGLISSRRANSLLNQRPDGAFLLRDSHSRPGHFVLSAK